VISFVLPAWNEERWLPGALAAVHAAGRASGRPYEIVVADDGSTDATAAVAAGAGARVVRVSHRQIAATRNAGAREARGEWLFFVDADTRVTPEVVRSALAALDAGAVGGGAAAAFDGATPLWSRVLLAALIRSFRLLRLAAGCFLFCRRADFEAVGGFDETLYAGEEIELSRALRRRGRFVVVREAVVTSARKLRSYSGLAHLALMLRLALAGRRGLRSRRLLGIWYDGRRDDPDAPPPVGPDLPDSGP
jgi:glycosyltransferase involved in cell wall biosynthesis